MRCLLKKSVGMKDSVLLIYTGGTIGMKMNPEIGSLSPFNFDQIIEEVPELRKFNVKIDTMAFDPIIDSSNLQPEVWSKLAAVIKENYEKYDGFVVLHGTDTMAYSASALSFMTSNLTKPIIFTGSQLPIGELRTDGKENLISAIEIAVSKNDEGKSYVPEVCVYFQNQLFRGNRTTKYNAEHFRAFRSPNYPPLAEAGINIHYNTPYILATTGEDTQFDVQTEMSPDVVVVKIFPGISARTFRAMLSIEGVKGIVLETYGSGNAPTDEWFVSAVKDAIARGVIIVNVTQCSAGSVEMARYETGVGLLDAGVVSGYDLTCEAAVTKLMYLIGQKLPIDEVKRQMNVSIRGEFLPKV